ncbi:hypothetical protein SAMN03159353_10542 [Cedecea sp. NFIX57]|nr:hypothetical protein SAMN03159353_10542 [Cedecea sp. NFIX57]
MIIPVGMMFFVLFFLKGKYIQQKMHPAIHPPCFTGWVVAGSLYTFRP